MPDGYTTLAYNHKDAEMREKFEEIGMALYTNQEADEMDWDFVYDGDQL